MSSILDKILRNLRRPLPDLCGFVVAKLLPMIWARYLSKTGSNFRVSQGARIQGGRAVSIGNGFYAGPMLWIEAVHSYLDHNYRPSIVIGNNVVCSNFVHIAATTSVTIGDNVLVGSGVHITDHAHGIYLGDFQDPP